MALVDDFKSRFPEINSSLIDSKFPQIADTWRFYYGGNYSIAEDKEVILNLLAHLFSVHTQSSSGSMLQETSKSVGSVSVSLSGAATTPSDSFWLSTRYGQAYFALIRNNFGPRFV